ncbi:MAG: ComEC/Rec2 family competence protein [Lachnospiraceae bacterium]|nr:ComEC/Rec2 family competence protein [Lachnospiraceae bacterium]
MASRRPMCFVCLLFLAAVYFFSGMSPPEPSFSVDEYDGRTVTVSGTVADRQIKNQTFQIYLKDVSFHDDIGQGTKKTAFPDKSSGIIVKTDTQTLAEYARLGSRIEARGIFAPFDVPTCEGQFDSRNYYMIRGYEGQLKRARILKKSESYGILTENLRRIRDGSFGILKESMSEDDASLVAAMTLGDKSGLDRDIKDLFQNAGISHILALSGLHIASVGMALLSFLKRLGMRVKAAALLSGTVIGLYSIMTGLSTSTVRAMLMFALSVVSVIAGRTYDLMSAAALSAVLIVIENPGYLYDSGFLMSFGAVIGIACIFPVFDRIPVILRISDFPRRQSGPVSEKLINLYRAVCITVSVTVATLPVTASSFMQISLCSVLINLIVIPLMGVVLFTGFSGIIVGWTGLNPAVILKITHYILWLYKYLGKISEKIDGNMLITGKPEKWQSITYVTIVILAVISNNIVLGRKNKNNTYAKNVDRSGRRNLLNDACNPKTDIYKITYVTENISDRRRKKRKNILVMTATIAMFGTAAVIITWHPRKEVEIRNIDVGQGDCALIIGDGIPSVMIDGGSSDVKLVGTYRILPVLKANRVPVVDYCVLTHMDNDHVNGMIELLEESGCPVRIRNIVVSYPVWSKSSENFERLERAADNKGCRIVSVSAGDVIKAGDMSMTIISPGPEGASVSGSSVPSTDENDNSIVFRLDHTDRDGGRFSALFTGDISENVEKKLSDRIGRVTYLKVAHHGSRYSSSDAFLSKVMPKVSVISSGEGNSYGHPHAETLERLAETGSVILRTDKMGEIIIKYDDGVMTRRTVLDDQLGK